MFKISYFNRDKQMLFAFVLASLLVGSLIVFLLYKFDYRAAWFLVLFIPFITYFYNNNFYFKYKFNFILFFFALILTSVFSLTTNIYLEGVLQSRNLFYLLIMFLGFTTFFYNFMYLLQKKVKCFISPRNSNKLWFVGVWFLIFTSWVPYLLAFMPGVMSADSIDQWAQATGRVRLFNHHPVFHTLLIRYTSAIWGDPIYYTLFQMFILSAGFSFIVYWLYKKGVSKNWLIVATLFFALHPLNAMYSVTMWKDVLFSLALGFFSLVLAEVLIFENKSKIWLVTFFVSGLLVLLLRNNGIYILSVLFVISLFYRDKRKLSAILGLIVLAYVIIVGPVFSSFKIKKSSLTESLGIPIQQVARTVYLEGKIAKNDINLISKVMPIENIKKNYTIAGVDPIKFHKSFDIKVIDKNKKEYLFLWARLLQSNPQVYLAGYLDSTRGFWDPVYKNWSTMYEVIPNKYGLEQRPISDKYSDLLATYVDKISWISPLYLLWSATVLNIIYLGVVFLHLARKQYLRILVLVPVLANWATFMIATPLASSTRYVYSSFVVLPIILFTLCNWEKDNLKKMNKV